MKFGLDFPEKLYISFDEEEGLDNCFSHFKFLFLCDTIFSEDSVLKTKVTVGTVALFDDEIEWFTATLNQTFLSEGKILLEKKPDIKLISKHLKQPERNIYSPYTYTKGIERILQKTLIRTRPINDLFKFIWYSPLPDEFVLKCNFPDLGSPMDIEYSGTYYLIAKPVIYEDRIATTVFDFRVIDNSEDEDMTSYEQMEVFITENLVNQQSIDDYNDGLTESINSSNNS